MPSRELELSEENLKLQEALSKAESASQNKDRRIRELEGKSSLAEETVKRVETEKKELTEALVKKEKFPEDIQNLPQLIEALKSSYKGKLESHVYSRVCELLDAKTSLIQLETAVKGIEATTSRFTECFKEAVSPDITQLSSNMGAVATVLRELIDRLNESERRNEDLRNLERQALEEWIKHMRKM